MDHTALRNGQDTNVTVANRRPDPGTRARAIVAALLAVVLLALVVLLQQSGAGHGGSKGGAGGAGGAGGVVAEVQPPEVDQQLMMSRLVVKLSRSEAMQGQGAGLLGQVDGMARSDVERLRAAVVAGELAGAEAGRRRLEELAGALPGDSPLRVDVEALKGLYAEPSVALSAEDAERLVSRHGFYGRLAKVFGRDDADAERAPLVGGGTALVVALFTAVLVGGGALVVGFGLAIVAVVMLFTGSLRFRFVPPAPGGSVMLEMLCVFMAGFVGLKAVAALTAMAAGPAVAGPVTLGVQWLLLLVVFYPVLRGVSWSQTRDMLGLRAERGVLREIGAGVVGYLACLPIMVLGVVASLVGMLIYEAIDRAMHGGSGGPATPENPLIEYFAGGSTVEIVMIALLATVWAPLCEEIVFRGATLRHLSAWMAPAVAALPTAIVFALMHGYPILLMGPVLALGFSFGLLRWWRGSLISAITAHAIHNSAVLALLLVILRLVGTQ